MNKHEIMELFRQGESLKLEFKSDLKCLPDRELVATVVALANTEGGDLLLGAEDDGTVTGLHPNHENVSGLPAMIANKTNPSISVRVELVEVGGRKVARISVPKSRQLVSTSEGLLQRRRLMANGKPEAVPFYPHEFIQRQSSMGLADPSAMPVREVSSDELDPLQRLRIRNAIKKYGGDQSLLPLADAELDGALGLTTTIDGRNFPTLAGLLILGNEGLLRRHLPAYEVAFQVLRGTNVLVNEFFRKPLLETFEEVELLFKARATSDLAVSVQRTEATVRASIEKLTEAGPMDAHGTGRGRTYTLSAKVYQQAGQKVAYVRQVGFDPIQQEQMVLSFIDKHGSIKRADVAELCHLSLPQAYRLLKRLENQGKIIQSGKMRHAFYTRTS